MAFGSVSRGGTAPDSDVDVLYTLEPGARLGWDIEKLADELSDPLGPRVDLVSRNALHEVEARIIEVEWAGHARGARD